MRLTFISTAVLATISSSVVAHGVDPALDNLNSLHPIEDIPSTAALNDRSDYELPYDTISNPGYGNYNIYIGGRTTISWSPTKRIANGGGTLSLYLVDQTNTTTPDWNVLHYEPVIAENVDRASGKYSWVPALPKHGTDPKRARYRILSVYGGTDYHFQLSEVFSFIVPPAAFEDRAESVPGYDVISSPGSKPITVTVGVQFSIAWSPTPYIDNGKGKLSLYLVNKDHIHKPDANVLKYEPIIAENIDRVVGSFTWRPKVPNHGTKDTEYRILSLYGPKHEHFELSNAFGIWDPNAPPRDLGAISGSPISNSIVERQSDKHSYGGPSRFQKIGARDVATSAPNSIAARDTPALNSNSSTSKTCSARAPARAPASAPATNGTSSSPATNGTSSSPATNGTSSSPGSNSPGSNSPKSSPGSNSTKTDPDHQETTGAAATNVATGFLALFGGIFAALLL